MPARNPHPIDFYYWSTPNGDKVLMMLEELSIPYRLLPINILKGEQFDEAFLAVSPNNKIPAITLYDSWGAAVNLFESGAILLHLAETSGQLLNPAKRLPTLQWLFWQMGGLGPMAGQAHHFNIYAPEPIPYAITRYEKETNRLYKVLNTQLSNRDYIVDEFSIADIACFPWIESHERQGVRIDDYPNIKQWLERLRARPSAIRTKAIHRQTGMNHRFDESARQSLFR